MEKETWALLGAAFAVGIPLVFNTIKETTFEYIKVKRERRYIIVQVIFMLDRYIAECEFLSRNEGIYDSETNQMEMVYTQPKLDLNSVKGDYKYLNTDMLYRLNSIEIKHAQVRYELSNVDDSFFDDAPEFSAYYSLRQTLYANQGLYVAKISEDICRIFKIKHISWENGFNPTQSIIEILKKKRASKSAATIRRMENRAKRIAKEKNGTP